MSGHRMIISIFARVRRARRRRLRERQGAPTAGTPRRRRRPPQARCRCTRRPQRQRMNDKGSEDISGDGATAVVDIEVDDNCASKPTFVEAAPGATVRCTWRTRVARRTPSPSTARVSTRRSSPATMPPSRSRFPSPAHCASRQLPRCDGDAGRLLRPDRRRPRAAGSRTARRSALVRAPRRKPVGDVDDLAGDLVPTELEGVDGELGKLLRRRS